MWRSLPKFIHEIFSACNLKWNVKSHVMKSDTDTDTDFQSFWRVFEEILKKINSCRIQVLFCYLIIIQLTRFLLSRDKLINNFTLPERLSTCYHRELIFPLTFPAGCVWVKGFIFWSCICLKIKIWGEWKSSRLSINCLSTKLNYHLTLTIRQTTSKARVSIVQRSTDGFLV